MSFSATPPRLCCPDRMPSPLDDFEQFNQQLDKAHTEFIALSQSQTPQSLAVQASRFSHFISQHYHELAVLVTPDLCERYLSDINVIQRKTGAYSKEELRQRIRSLELRLAYKTFQRGIDHSWSEGAELIAFQKFVATHFPDLGAISDEEAKVTRSADRSERHRFIALNVGFGLLSLVFLSASWAYSKGSPETNTPAARITPAGKQFGWSDARRRTENGEPLNGPHKQKTR